MVTGESAAGYRQEDPFEVLTPDRMMSAAKIVIYGTEYCSYCTAARMLLKKKGLDYEDVLVSADDDKRREMEERSGERTVPQIFINDEAIGGFDDLYSLDRDGRLDEILGRSPTPPAD